MNWLKFIITASLTVSAAAFASKTTIPNELPRIQASEIIDNAEVMYGSVRTSDGTARRVIVTKPQQSGKFAAILFIGGIGCYL